MSPQIPPLSCTRSSILLTGRQEYLAPSNMIQDTTDLVAPQVHCEGPGLAVFSLCGVLMPTQQPALFFTPTFIHSPAQSSSYTGHHTKNLILDFYAQLPPVCVFYNRTESEHLLTENDSHVTKNPGAGGVSSPIPPILFLTLQEHGPFHLDFVAASSATTWNM